VGFYNSVVFENWLSAFFRAGTAPKNIDAHHRSTRNPPNENLPKKSLIYLDIRNANRAENTVEKAAVSSQLIILATGFLHSKGQL
jgi:hypothetical protein